ncbi:3-demethylubiquinol 3-O-methyltransferase (plasmid) [Rhodovulum sp. P5]|uniref:class I SAM-dependent methyltransferase n=1 Tax=Rhodovulum sp. P5 TaxID=1564506 RepID=UPI0009C2C511|nr:class I SAM-dependent methyltransferase [Rhodovulum sp. P5]ARE42548.1 3-demethylubiquinol 3-O-methyltransferase [Rhodovulum sp. P5]
MALFPDISEYSSETWMRVPGDWRRPAVDERYTVLWDRARKYGQVSPRPAAADVPAFYEIQDYYTHSGTALSAGATRTIGQKALEHLAWRADRGTEPDARWWAEILGDAPRRILEIGCGNGTNLTTLAALGHDVTGVEPDPAAREVARKAGFEVHPGTAEALPDRLAGETFDAVVFMHVLEHCVDPAAAMGNAVGLLGTGGLLIAEVPNNECLGAAHFGPLWHWLDVPRHLNFFTRNSLCALFEDAGLSVEDVLFRGYCRQFGPAWREVQAHIAAVFGMDRDRRIGTRSYWLYLLQTAAAAPGKKYDSVRVVGKLPR